MLSAIRNLGILKMIEVIPEFDFNALESVDRFLEQRKKAIVNGEYAKLQFESINADNIGIFSISNGGNIKFEEEKISNDSWKFLFLKTASQGTYLAPTWKDSATKLERTIGKFSNESSEIDDYWLQNCVEIFTSNEIKTGELDADGELILKSFSEVMAWAKGDKNLKVFSVNINSAYNAEIPELLDFVLENKSINYQTNDAQYLPDGICSLCNKSGKLFPNVLSRDGVGINIGNVDKPGFFPDVSRKSAIKAFPICAPCAETLYAAKFHAFSDLTFNISGHRVLVIPHLLESEDKKYGLEILTSDLKRLREDISGAKQTERNIIEDLSENKGIASVTFIIGDVSGQAIENIRKVIPSVLPSRLSEISKVIIDINEMHDNFPDEHPWKLKYLPINSNLGILKNVFGVPKYSNQNKSGGRKPFKASSIDTLNLLSAIFLKKEYSSKSLISEFSTKLSYDFLGTLAHDSNIKPTTLIRYNITNMVYLLHFLEKLEVIKISSGTNYVSKYLEGHEGLIPLNDFLNADAKGLDTKEKQYAFLTGLLFGKLISIQIARGVSTNALKWLKGLQLSSQDLMDIFVNTRRKLDNYSMPKSAWSEEMNGVAEAIAVLGAEISNWDISRKEIPYYLCLGQSLSKYYLPSKSINKQKNTDGGN